MNAATTNGARPQRLGFLIPEFPQQTHVAWWRVADGMRQEGVDVHLLSTRRPTQPCPHPQLLAAAQQTTYLWPPSPGDLAAVPALLRHAPAVVHYLASLQAVRGVRRVKSLAFVAAALRLRRIAAQRHFDHVFAHSCADAAHAIALSRVLGGPPYSLRLGGDLEVYGGDHRQKMARATLIVPAARAYEPRLVDEVGVAPERVMWSWVGTDTERFAPGPARPKGGPLQLVTVARLNPAKGYQVMIPALARLRAAGVPFRYRIVGAGPYEAAIREAIAAHQLHDAVELLGSQSAEHIAGLLAASDVFVLPTNGLGEGTPAAVCEAMSAGVAVVATAVGGIADMIDDGVHGRIVPPGDEAALAAALQQLAGDRAALARMASACRTKALAQFDCRAVARRILDKIASLPVNPR